MRIPLSDFDVWDFYRTDSGEWKWCRKSPDGDVLIEARSTFASLDACQSDAQRSGYGGVMNAGEN